ncbi:hypothetical protein PRBEI_2000476200 [Prionailurus iriomotensis]
MKGTETPPLLHNLVLRDCFLECKSVSLQRERFNTQPAGSITGVTEVLQRVLVSRK